MFYFYIVVSGEGGYGHFGRGMTLKAARDAWRKAGGRKKDKVHKTYICSSKLPFAPFDKDAMPNEADAWVNQDGSISTVRCDIREME